MRHRQRAQQRLARTAPGEHPWEAAVVAHATERELLCTPRELVRLSARGGAVERGVVRLLPAPEIGHYAPLLKRIIRSPYALGTVSNVRVPLVTGGVAARPPATREATASAEARDAMPSLERPVATRGSEEIMVYRNRPFLRARQASIERSVEQDQMAGGWL